MLFGKTSHTAMSDEPSRTANSTFTAPRNRIEPFVRAPNRNWPANPPAPWHIGIAPNQQPTRFIMPTETATFRGVAGRSGNRSIDKAHTAITEFNVVSGICGTAADLNELVKS